MGSLHHNRACFGHHHGNFPCGPDLVSASSVCGFMPKFSQFIAHLRFQTILGRLKCLLTDPLDSEVACLLKGSGLLGSRTIRQQPALNRYLASDHHIKQELVDTDDRNQLTVKVNDFCTSCDDGFVVPATNRDSTSSSDLRFYPESRCRCITLSRRCVLFIGTALGTSR